MKKSVSFLLFHNTQKFEKLKTNKIKMQCNRNAPKTKMVTNFS